ncbi:MAG: hypothetical protein JKY37_32285 [Nannocystaceae bacterium]|nr:hypothetical protein [Nannocystaceae bacterium]
MMVSSKSSLIGLLRWQQKNVLLYASAALMALLLIRAAELVWLELPVLPLQVIGAAIGIFVSFRTNSAYDRWWEARKLWGGLINVSRMFATQAVTYLAPADREVTTRLVHRHIAYVHALRSLLRGQDPLQDETFLAVVPDDPDSLRGQSNLTHALVHMQLHDVVALDAQGKLSEFRTQSIDRSLTTILDVQGGCERIKNTPFPKGYGFIADRLVLTYAVLLPFALVHTLGWMAIPANVLVCLSFSLISEAGRVLEDPFNLFWNGLPLSNMSQTIERNLRERLGETELPEIPGPDKQGILM